MEVSSPINTKLATNLLKLVNQLLFAKKEVIKYLQRPDRGL